MYRDLPRGDQIALRTTTAAAWVGLALAGAGGAFVPGRSVVNAVDSAWIVQTSGWATMIAAIIAAIGISWPKAWFLEWIGAGFAGAGILYYASAPWMLLFHGEIGRFQQSFIISACLIGFIIYRIVWCITYARKLSRHHDAEKLIGRLEYDGDQ